MTQFRIGFAGVLTLLAPALVLARSTGIGAGYSGAPGDQVCAACHTGTALNGGGGSVKISFGGATNYTPGQIMHVQVTIADPGQQRWGFEVSPRLASDPSKTGAGNLATVDDNAQLTPANGTLQWIQHTSAGTRNGTKDTATFSFDWTPPATNVGDVTFYVAANAANGNGNNQGDHIYTTTATLSAATGKPTATGVSNGADFSKNFTSGMWFTVFGSNFGSNTRLWTGKDIVDGKLPSSLDSVGVTVNGKPASVYFISPGQINAQAPDDTATGTVNVVVTTPSGSSDPVQVTLLAEAPALFTFSPQNARYAAAVATDGAYLGPAGLFGAGVTSRPAKSGETISLYGNGFGKTNPVVAAGQAFNGSAPLVTKPTVTIGGVNATVSFSGLSATSLYQFNVVVPSGLTAGDQKIVMSINGRQTQDNLYLSIQP